MIGQDPKVPYLAMDAIKLKAWRAFLEAHAAITRLLDQELRAERSLPLTWYDALLQLHEGGGSLRMHELADRLLLSRSATTRFADRLEKAGLIGRRQSSVDRRGTEVRLTERGREALRGAAPVHIRGIEMHFGSVLTPKEAEVLAAALQRVASVCR